MKYQISMAPMEGLTGYVYRRAHHAYFAPLDTYYKGISVPSKLHTNFSSQTYYHFLP